MRILFINSILRTAEKGVIPEADSIKDSMAYNFCLAFRKLGHDVVLIAAEEYRPLRNEHYDMDVLFMKSYLPKLFPPAQIPFHPGLIRLLFEKGASFDLIISGEVFSINSLISAILTPQTLVIWHELPLHPRKFLGVPSKVWYALIPKLFMKNVCIVPRSERARTFLLGYFHSLCPITVAHGVDLNKFCQQVTKDDYFVIVSRLVLGKRVDKSIRAFSEMIRNSPYQHYRLVIVGDGDQRAPLQELVNAMGIANLVNFVGRLHHEDVVEYLGRAKAMLVSTEQDNSMFTIWESIACATPIISNTIPDNTDFVIKHNLGIVRDDWNESDLIHVVRNNREYVRNCANVRHWISFEAYAMKMVVARTA